MKRQIKKKKKVILMHESESTALRVCFGHSRAESSKKTLHRSEWWLKESSFFHFSSLFLGISFNLPLSPCSSHFAYDALYLLNCLLASEVYPLLNSIRFVFVPDYSLTPFSGFSSFGSICFYLFIFYGLTSDSVVVYFYLSLE